MRRTTRPRPIRLLWRTALCVVLLAGLLTGFQRAGFLYKRDNSLPGKIYRFEKTGEYRRGDLVLLCIPEGADRFAEDRRYFLFRGRPCPEEAWKIGKEILAVPGDQVEISRRGIAVNGQLLAGTRPIAQDAEGRPLAPALSPATKLEAGWLIVGTRYPASYDSRYFGPVPETYLAGKIRRVF